MKVWGITCYVVAALNAVCCGSYWAEGEHWFAASSLIVTALNAAGGYALVAAAKRGNA